MLDGADPFLACGAWAAVWYDFGPPGLTLGGRPELAAAARVSGVAGAEADIVTDCECVANGLLVLRRRGLREGMEQCLNGDLWSGVAVSPPGGRWIRSHHALADELAAGWSSQEWDGSRRAAAPAQAAAGEARPSLDVRAAGPRRSPSFAVFAM